MSRVGRVPIAIPEKVRIALKENTIKVEGPKGTLQLEVPPRVEVEEQDGQLVIRVVLLVFYLTSVREVQDQALLPGTGP